MERYYLERDGNNRMKLASKFYFSANYVFAQCDVKFGAAIEYSPH